MLSGVALLMMASGCSASATAGPLAPQAPPDLSVGAERYPEDESKL